MKRGICTLILTLLVLSALADGFFCRVRNFAADNGLLQAHISNAQQDNLGFMWFATWNGLVRFDGHEFNTFKPVLLSDGTIFSNRIYNIKMSHNGDIWCISSDNRLYSFDTRTCRFTDIHRLIPAIGDKKVKSLTPLPNGVTWVTFKDFSCLRMVDSAYVSNSVYYPVGSSALHGADKILDIVQGQNGDEWVLTNAGAINMTRHTLVKGTYRYGCNVGTLFCLVATDGRYAWVSGKKPVSGRLSADSLQVAYVTEAHGQLVVATDKGIWACNPKVSRPRQLSPHASGFLFADSRQRVWSFNGTASVDMIDLTSGLVKTMTAESSLQKSKMKNPQLIFEDADHHIILKPEQGTLSYYDEQSGLLRSCRFYQDNEVRTFSPTEISKFLTDYQGNLWVFQKNAANCISFYPDHFEHWQNTAKEEVRGMMYDSMGRHWVSDLSNALYLLDGKQSPTYLSATGMLTSAHIQFSRKPVYCITEDREHRVWVGTKGDGVYLLTPTNTARTSFNITHFLHDASDDGSLHSDTIWNIRQDSRGQIWLCSYEHGMSRVGSADPKNGYRFKKVGGLPHGVRIRCLMEVQPGIMLIGTTNGLLTADFRNPEKPSYYHNTYRNEEWGLKGNDVMRIVKCRNRLYACIFGSGISEIISSNLLSDTIHFRNYLIPTTATADQIKTAISEGDNIWLASSQAIVRFNTVTASYTLFDRTNFIGDFNFSEGAPVMRDGRIIAGTTDGLLFFSPESVAIKRAERRIVFTGIQYQNDMTIRPVNDIQSLTIAPDQRSFSLFLSSLGYNETRDIPFRYRLEGWDNGWNYNGENQHAVSYNNLQPGDYTLVVQVMGENGTWNNASRTISIHVTPRFVETVWFKLLMLSLLVMVFLGMLYAITYLNRMRNLLQKKYSLLMTVEDFSKDIKVEKSVPEHTDTDEREFMRQTIAFFEENIGNRNFVVEDLARHLGMSRTAYYQKMKSITGLSPVDFIKQMRIKKALKLLDGGMLSVSDVAYKVGFSDPKYFSKCFKAEMGVTPTQYVNSLSGD